jgi:26S proteasome non-ATPase regulatory subunit 10
VARKLLAKPDKASARISDTRQQLPLHRAAAVGNVPMVKLLLEHNSPLNASDRNGLTALHHAIAEGHGDVALELLRSGAESDKRDAEGNLPIKLAPDMKVAKWIVTEAEKEGVEIAIS